jgi:tetratricopeptide (TPR) repeat protein
VVSLCSKLLLITLSPVLLAQNSPTLEQFNRAQELVTSFKFNEAVSALTSLQEQAGKGAVRSPLMAPILDTIGIVYLELHKCSEAEQAFKRALRILGDGPSLPPLDTMAVKNHLGETFLECRRPSEAARIFEDVVEIRTAEGSSGDIYLADALDALACAYAANRKLDQAEAMLRRSLGILGAIQHREPERTALALDDLATILKTANRYSEALTYAESARTALRGASSLARPLAITNLSLLGSLYLLSNHLNDAVLCARQSVSLAEELYGPDNPRLGSLMATAADVLRKSNQKTEAKVMQKRAAQIKAQTERENPSVRYTVDVKALR